MNDVAELLHLEGTQGLKERVIPSSQTLLIRTIQKHFGEEPCFASDRRNDCAEICEWRRDCRPLKAAWLR